jgi:hypothetical protein
MGLTTPSIGSFGILSKTGAGRRRLRFSFLLVTAGLSKGPSAQDVIASQKGLQAFVLEGP